MTYAVTGSTGALGTLVIQHLLDLGVPSSSIVALARNKAKAAKLEDLGITIRIADYEEPSSLEKALHGVDHLLLVSGSEVGKRAGQHGNVISAAKKSGVSLLVYTSITRADTSVSPLAPEHKSTEEAIRKSGLPYVILRNNWYTENYIDDVKRAGTTGTLEAAVGKGKVSSASRSDYAEAAARVLVGEGHAGKIYELAGDAWDYSQLAHAASEILGSAVAFKALSPEQRTQSLLAAGMPQGVADFVVGLDRSIEAGALAEDSADLEHLLGRKPLSLKDGLKASVG
jgi:NAD(P)H dehydrogenase (quinone)